MKTFKLAGEDDSMAVDLEQLHSEMGFNGNNKAAIDTIQVGEVCNCEEGVQVVRVS